MDESTNPAENFLPDFQPVVTHGTDTVQCLIRDKAVRATPEECVRQRVLHWLIHKKGWRKDCNSTPTNASVTKRRRLGGFSTTAACRKSPGPMSWKPSEKLEPAGG